MKRIIGTVLLLLPYFLPCVAQTWEEVQADSQTYLYGEGRGETIDEADQQALASLISKISVVVSSNYEMLEGARASAQPASQSLHSAE